jgi:hypothetical protein
LPKAIYGSVHSIVSEKSQHAPEGGVINSSRKKVYAPFVAQKGNYSHLSKLSRHYSIWHNGCEIDRVASLVNAVMLWEESRDARVFYVMEVVSKGLSNKPVIVKKLSAAFLFELRRQTLTPR